MTLISRIVKLSLCGLLLLTRVELTFSQVPFPTRSQTHIFWQPTTKLDSIDFKGEVIADRVKSYCDSLNLCTVAYVGMFSVLDMPSKKSDRRRKLEKIYFAPAFEIGASYKAGDSKGIDQQQIVFDIYELSTRLARRSLKEIIDSTPPSYGLLTIFFKTVESDVVEFRDKIIFDYTHDIYIAKKPGAYEEWRKWTDKQLEDSKEYATTPEECYRFVMNIPIQPGYIMAEEVTGDLRK